MVEVSPQTRGLAAAVCTRIASETRSQSARSTPWPAPSSVSSRAAGISSVAAPTLVIHGTADPMFPLAHGQALAGEIPGAKLLTLEGVGHGVERADWERVSDAILAHTAAASPRV